MRLNIELLKEEQADCFEISFFAVSAYYGLEYRLYFAHAWNLRYDEQASTFFGKLDKGDELISQLRKAGLSVRFNRTNDKERFIEAVKREIDHRRPVVMRMKSHRVPWDNNYRNESAGIVHAFIIHGYDDEQRCFYCLDCWYGKREIRLPYDFETDEEIVYFATEKGDIQDDWGAMLTEALSNVPDETFDGIARWAEDLANENLQTWKIDKRLFWFSELWLALSNIARGRFQFASFMRLYGEKVPYDWIADTIEEVTKLGYEWETVRNIVVKACLAGKDKVDLAEKLLQLKNKEQSVLRSVKELHIERHALSNVEQSETYRTVHSSEVEAASQYPIDLKPYFNNKGFSTEREPGNLTGLNTSFASKDLPDSAWFRLNSIAFAKPDERSEADNIACNGEEIELPDRHFAYIAFLGCSEWGSYAETMELTYADGVTSTVVLEISDWKTEPVFDDEIVWQGWYVNTDGLVTGQQVSLFARIIRVDRPVRQIKLPRQPCLHIFAITLIEGEQARATKAEEVTR
ncbi:C39 family peptidase [Paenibacillaceae bacterium WGS1546]|uniref:C39 family peptidase n=1 Tax=Cohnella sp. WGS1546 TaxID=3366810 RepID=UPI00372D13D9